MKINLLKKNCFLIFYFILLLFFPLFPTLMGVSQLHINFIFFFVAFLALMMCVRISFDYFILSSYILFFLLVLSSSILYGDVVFSDIPSIFRPLFLLVIFLFFLNYLAQGSDSEAQVYSILKFTRLLKRMLIPVIFFSLVISLFEVFGEGLINDYIHFLYKREDRLDFASQATTFFGQTYYSGFVFLTIMTLIMGLTADKTSWSDWAVISFSFFIVLLSQSKPAIFVSFFLIFLFVALKARTFFLIAVPFVFMLIALLHQYLFSFIIDILLGIDTIGTRSLLRMLEGVESSGSLSVRLNQISETYYLVLGNNPFLGLGVGRGVLLESWVAEMMFRYGFIGIFVFIVMVFYLTFISLVSFFRLKKEGFVHAHLPLFLAIWFLSLPILLLSSNMIENSKTAIVSMFVIALTVRLNKATLTLKNNPLVSG